MFSRLAGLRGRRTAGVARRAMSTAPAAEAISRKAPPPLRKSPGQSSLGIGAVIARKKMMRDEFQDLRKETEAGIG